MTLSIEEEIFLASGLLTDDYDPESILEEGEEHLSEDERKEDLISAREALTDVKGRIPKLDPFEVGKDFPTPSPGSPGLRIAFMFGSPREGLAVAYGLGDIRIYCEPKQSLPGDGYRRMTVNRLMPSPAIVHELLSKDAFVEEVSEEIRWQLREECPNPACRKAVQHDWEICEFCNQDLEEEEGDGGEGEEEAPEAAIDPAAPVS